MNSPLLPPMKPAILRPSLKHRRTKTAKMPSTTRRTAKAVDSNVDGNVDEDTNEGVDGAKAAEVMAVALAPFEGGYMALEGDMTQPLPG